MRRKVLKRLTFILVITLCLAMIPVFVSAKSGVSTKGVTKKAGKAGRYTVTMKQTKVGSLNVKVKFPKIKKDVYKVKVTMYMKYGGKTTTKKTVTVKRKKLKGKAFTFKTPAYGKYYASVRFYNKKGKTLKKVTVKNVGVIAAEYNIALLNGSFGPTYFSMSLVGAEDKNNPGVGVKTKTASGAVIPTIFSVTRATTYNWSAMPANTYRNPLDRYYKTLNKYNPKINSMAQYVKELRSLNKYSKFHFYLSDIAVSNLARVVYMNKIPDNRFDCTFITDGTASYYRFNAMYNLDGVDPQGRYDEMVPEWNKYVAAARSGKLIPYTDIKYANEQAYFDMDKYTYVAVKETPNITWWISRFSGTFASQNADFLAEAKTQMIEMGMNRMLVSIQEKGKAAAFKKWFNLSSNMFEAAQKNKKEVMILMGTRIDLEKNFEEFGSFVKNYYGDAYEYYYKGHPASPTGLHPEKQEQLDKLGIHDIESSIPAELILFFNPDVYCSGMSNSTLNQSYKPGRTKAYFGTRKSGAGSITAGDLFELFFTKITDDYESEIKDLCGGDLENSFLMEFMDTSAHEIGIYNYADDSIRYYKLSDGAYTEVDKDGNPVG